MRLLLLRSGSEALSGSADGVFRSTKLSDADNKAIYGKCNHANGHGHNYRGKAARLAGFCV